MCICTLSKASILSLKLYTPIFFIQECPFRTVVTSVNSVKQQDQDNIEKIINAQAKEIQLNNSASQQLNFSTYDKDPKLLRFDQLQELPILPAILFIFLVSLLREFVLKQDNALWLLIYHQFFFTGWLDKADHEFHKENPESLLCQDSNSFNVNLTFLMMLVRTC